MIQERVIKVALDYGWSIGVRMEPAQIQIKERQWDLDNRNRFGLAAIGAIKAPGLRLSIPATTPGSKQPALTKLPRAR